ncbi:hypothetical protein AVEN_61137-1, partial [Araneus ventricosus]
MFSSAFLERPDASPPVCARRPRECCPHTRGAQSRDRPPDEGRLHAPARRLPLRPGQHGQILAAESCRCPYHNI